jgi:hypothetical protein
VKLADILEKKERISELMNERLEVRKSISGLAHGHQ